MRVTGADRAWTPDVRALPLRPCPPRSLETAARAPAESVALLELLRFRRLLLCAYSLSTGTSAC
jgi:hypothetical protein